jgi:hypothetical protein
MAAIAPPGLVIGQFIEMKRKCRDRVCLGISALTTGIPPVQMP